VKIPPEALNQLRFGRGVDNRRYKAAGFGYQYTSREAVLGLGEHLRLKAVARGAGEPYHYEREVEEFLRWSPHVKNARGVHGGALTRQQVVQLQRLLGSLDTAPGAADRRRRDEGAPRRPADGAAGRESPASPPVEHYDDLAAEEVIALLGSLEADDLILLREHESAHAGRDRVLTAIDSVLARAASR
jgi:UDP-glucose 4-epimerase